MRSPVPRVPPTTSARSVFCIAFVLRRGLTDRAQAAARRQKIHSLIYARRQLQALVRQPLTLPATRPYRAQSQGAEFV